MRPRLPIHAGTRAWTARLRRSSPGSRSTRSVSPDLPCCRVFHSSMPSIVSRDFPIASTGPSASSFRNLSVTIVAISMTVSVCVSEACHFQVNPDQVARLVRRAIRHDVSPCSSVGVVYMPQKCMAPRIPAYFRHAIRNRHCHIQPPHAPATRSRWHCRGPHQGQTNQTGLRRSRCRGSD